MTLNNSVVTRNVASGTYSCGGGIYLWQGSLTTNNSTISDNWAGEYGGGAICYFQWGVTLNNTTISGNTSNNDGGGIYPTKA